MAKNEKPQPTETELLLTRVQGLEREVASLKSELTQTRSELTKERAYVNGYRDAIKDRGATEPTSPYRPHFPPSWWTGAPWMMPPFR